MILVTGAAGKTGQAVLRALAKKGADTRAMVHSQPQAAAATKAGASDAVSGDLLDPNVWREALQDIDSVYLICPNMHPNESEIGKIAIAATKAAGVRRFVYHSVLFPQIEAMPHHWQKLRVEEILIESRVDFTILQPASYMQNILPYWEVIRKSGEYRPPYSPESRFSPADLEDVAEAAADVLLKNGHTGGVYQLAGTEILSSIQMAEIAAAYLGRAVTASNFPIEEWKTANTNLPSAIRQSLLKMFDYYDQHDFFGSSKTLEFLLGRPPANFAQFLTRLAK